MRFLDSNLLNPQALHEAKLTLMRQNSPIVRSIYGKEAVRDMEEMNDILNLRYEVYCKEACFISKDLFADCKEVDQYDANSIHIASYNHDDFILGTVRLVRPLPGQNYPFQNHCKTFQFIRPPARDETAEISRLIITKKLRGRRNDSLQGILTKQVETEEEFNSNLAGPQISGNEMILLSMFREMYKISKTNGIRYWYATMEKGLARQLTRMGFEFISIGRQADYYGAVTPYIADLQELEFNLRKGKRELWEWFNETHIKSNGKMTLVSGTGPKPIET
ncbi:MAG: PEP-CTERM/exosortase system-associated acyltransferase [Candidatus Saccharibacteria bacterium]|nr:PEP-CTERM/exosortase system-associated acyltransferase [Candidatus Saccharibacteria bacterium]